MNWARVFVWQRRPEIHLFAARFKEEHGDIDGARFEYELLNSNLAPGLLESVVKAANFEHRQVHYICCMYNSSYLLRSSSKLQLFS